MALNPEGNSLESFPEGHPVFPPEMATNEPAGLISVILQLRPGNPCDTTS